MLRAGGVAAAVLCGTAEQPCSTRATANMLNANTNSRLRLPLFLTDNCFAGCMSIPRNRSWGTKGLSPLRYFTEGLQTRTDNARTMSPGHPDVHGFLPPLEIGSETLVRISGRSVRWAERARSWEENAKVHQHYYC